MDTVSPHQHWLSDGTMTTRRHLKEDINRINLRDLTEGKVGTPTTLQRCITVVIATVLTDTTETQYCTGR